MRAGGQSQVLGQPCHVFGLDSQKEGPTFLTARESFVAFSRRESFRLCMALHMLILRVLIICIRKTFCNPESNYLC
jgi:hypothetical protein